MNFKRCKKAGLLLMLVGLVPMTVLAHGGRTDGNGGHRDNKNASGLGSYHYHCNGKGPHLHTKGVCPYKTTTATTSSSANKVTQPVKPTVKDVAFNIFGESISIAAVEKEGRTLVQLRDLGDALGLDVVWTARTERIDCSDANNSLVMSLNSDILTVNGAVQYMSVKPEVIDGRTYIPVRYIAEAVGHTVAVDNGVIKIY